MLKTSNWDCTDGPQRRLVMTLETSSELGLCQFPAYISLKESKRQHVASQGGEGRMDSTRKALPAIALSLRSASKKVLLSECEPHFAQASPRASCSHLSMLKGAGDNTMKSQTLSIPLRVIGLSIS